VDKSDYLVVSMTNTRKKPTKRASILKNEFSPKVKAGGPGYVLHG